MDFSSPLASKRNSLKADFTLEELELAHDGPIPEALLEAALAASAANARRVRSLAPLSEERVAEVRNDVAWRRRRVAIAARHRFAFRHLAPGDPRRLTLRSDGGLRDRLIEYGHARRRLALLEALYAAGPSTIRGD